MSTSNADLSMSEEMTGSSEAITEGECSEYTGDDTVSRVCYEYVPVFDSSEVFGNVMDYNVTAEPNVYDREIASILSSIVEDNPVDEIIDSSDFIVEDSEEDLSEVIMCDEMIREGLKYFDEDLVDFGNLKEIPQDVIDDVFNFEL